MEAKNTTVQLHLPTKELTHVSQMKNQYAYNRALIERELKLSSDKYEGTFFEYGCLFLERMYDRSIPEMEVWYLRLAQNPKFMFWMWFKAEFKIMENDFINELHKNEKDLTEEMWFEFINTIPTDVILEKSLINLLVRRINHKL